MSEAQNANDEIIQILERRQHELEKRQAIQGINTDPAVTLEIENIKKEVAERKKGKAQEISDAFLSFVLALGAISLEPVPLTLTFQGVTVAGYVTNPEKFHDHWWQTIIEPGAMSYNPDILEASRNTYSDPK